MDQLKIGRLIAKQRKEKKLTQEELAQKLGVNNRTISRWENGNYMPDISMMKFISKELDIPLNELLDTKIRKKKKISKKNILGGIIIVIILLISFIWISYKVPFKQKYNGLYMKIKDTRFSDNKEIYSADYYLETTYSGDLDEVYKEVTLGDNVKCSVIFIQFKSLLSEIIKKQNDEFSSAMPINYENKPLLDNVIIIYSNKDLKDIKQIDFNNSKKTEKFLEKVDDEDYKLLYVNLKEDAEKLLSKTTEDINNAIRGNE